MMSLRLWLLCGGYRQGVGRVFWDLTMSAKAVRRVWGPCDGQFIMHGDCVQIQ